MAIPITPAHQVGTHWIGCESDHPLCAIELERRLTIAAWEDDETDYEGS